MVDAYNPLDKRNLANSIAAALLTGPIRDLRETADRVGAGVYAVYYVGLARPFAPYAPLAARNAERAYSQPIYIGKAIPKGGRKGGLGLDATQGTALRARLAKHARSIEAAGTTLAIEDFSYRCLVVDDIWIPLGENILIEEFKPLWNMVVDGFGNNDPGGRRKDQFRSSWDVLHPGRDWAEKLGVGPNTTAEITKRIGDFFSGRFVPGAPVDSGDES